MGPPDPLISAPPSLSETLRQRTDALLSRIVRANYDTQFARTASELAELRNATAGRVDGTDDDVLSETFRNTVPFTTYDAYSPLIARFSDTPCKASATMDLLAPGLPDYIVRSSSTSGGAQKLFPKYNRFPKSASPEIGPRVIADPLGKRTSAFVSHFWALPMHVVDENDRLVKTMYLSSVTAMNRRTPWNLHPENDKERMGTFILDHAVPYAAGFIGKYHSFLLIHALFAASSKAIEIMFIPFVSTFVDMMRQLDAEFDLVVDCIANGTVPDLDGIADLRHYFEVNMLPDPERAAELRGLGRPSSRPGWCGDAWPNMRSITTTASGSFATYVPLTRWFLGPNIDVHAHGYGCTESRIAGPYNPLELNQFKPINEDVIEFLDINKSDSISDLAQLWEVTPGRRYEVVVTTQDGLWRYRLGDVIEISGFDPTDGIPIFQFIERRNAIRLPLFVVTEEELRAAILTMTPNTTVPIVGWTAVVDERQVPSTVGFFVELADDQAPDLTLATERMADHLSRSIENAARGLKTESFRKPTVRLVRPGTFTEFIQLRLDEGGSNNMGQVKVPIVLSKTEHVAWFSDRVVREV